MTQKSFRMLLDTLITLLSIVLMGGTVLFSNGKVHQIMGMVMLVLWLVHIALHKRWFASIAKGSYTAARTMQLVVNVAIQLCALLSMLSGLMMAWFVPAEFVGGALGFARRTHLIASHWYYIFMAFHLGLHANMILSRCFDAHKNRTQSLILRIAGSAISLYGVYAFIARGLWKYLFLQQQFFFLDIERGYVLFALDYLSIIFLFGTLSFYMSKLLRKCRNADSK